MNGVRSIAIKINSEHFNNVVRSRDVKLIHWLTTLDIKIR